MSRKPQNSPEEYHAGLKRLSWSGYNTYQRCPTAYEFRYVKNKRVPFNAYNTIGGKTVQRVFELFYNNEIWRRGKDAQKTLLEILEREYSRILSRETVDWSAKESKLSREELYESLIPTIPLTMQVIKDHKLLGRYAKSEIKLQAWIDKTLVHGIADFVIRRENEHMILDGKLTRHRNKYLKRDQLVWYSMLFYLQHRVLVDKTGWIFYTYGELEWVPISAEDVSRLHREVEATIKLIKQRKFPATPGEDACRFCDFKPICPAGKEASMNKKVAAGERKQAKLEAAGSPLLNDDPEIGF